MKNFIKTAKKNGGFSLVELIIVIAILAVIAAIAVPSLLKSVEKSRYTTDIANAKRVAEAVQIHIAETEGATIPSGKCEIKATGNTGFVEKVLQKLDGKIPTATSQTFKGNFYFEIVNNKVTVTANSKEVYPTPAPQS